MSLNPKMPPDSALDPLEEVMRAALAGSGQAIPPASGERDPLAASFTPPTDPDAYMIQVPRGIARDGTLETKARRWFHEAGLPQNLVSGIVQEYCRCLAKPVAADGDEGRVMAELARDWGPECARKIDLARAVIARCGDTADIENVLAESGLGNNPWLIRSLAAFAELPADMGQDAGRPA